MADIRLAKPAAGTTQTVPSAPDGRFIFDFPADAATLTRNGDDLVLSFEDGSSIQLQGFYTTYSKEEMPSFQVDGVEISGQDFFAALGEDLMPAAGPAASSSASRGGRYNEYGGSDLLDGIDHLGRLDIGFDDGVEWADDKVGGWTHQNLDPEISGIIAVDGNDMTLVESGVETDGSQEIQGNVFTPGVPVVVGQVMASDPDGGRLSYSFADGSNRIVTEYGVITIDADTGVITYTLNNDDPDADSLALGETVRQDFTVRVEDGQGGKAEASFSVTIKGTNDQPEVTLDADSELKLTESGVGRIDSDTVVDAPGTEEENREYNGSHYDPGRNEQHLEGKVTGADVDAGHKLWFGAVAGDKSQDGGWEGAQSPDAGIFLGKDATDDDVESSAPVEGDFGHLVLNSDGTWTYTLKGEGEAVRGTASLDGETFDIDSIDALPEGATITDTFTIYVKDEHGAWNLETVTITITGSNDKPSLTVGAPEGLLYESGVGRDTTTSDHSPVDKPGQPEENSPYDNAAERTASVTGSIDAADVDHGDILHFAVADGSGVTTPEGLGLTTGSQTSVTAQGHYGQLVVTETANGTASYTYTLNGNSDGTPLTFPVTVNGKTYASLEELKQGLDWDFDGQPTLDNLPEGATVSESFTIFVQDDKGAWQQQEVSFTITGTNDQPEVTLDADSELKLTESGVGRIDSDTVVDAPGTEEENREYNGSHYDPGRNEQHLEGKVTGADVDAGHKLWFGAVAGDKSQDGGWEGAQSPDAGIFLGKDATDDDVESSAPVEGDFGHLVLNSDGTWTYTLKGEGEAVRGTASLDGETFDIDSIDALPEGATITDTFTIYVKDEHGAWNLETVTITITGTNDKPSLEIKDGDGQILADGAVLETKESDPADANDSTDWPEVSGSFGIQDVDADAGSDQTIRIEGGSHTEDGNDYTTTGSSSDGHIGSESGAETSATFTTEYGQLTVNPDGTWTYEVNGESDAVQQLDPEHPHYETFKITVVDEHGAYDTREIVIKVEGSSAFPVITGKDDLVFKEEGVYNDGRDGNTPTEAGDVVDGQGNVIPDHHQTGSLLGQVDATDVDLSDQGNLSFRVEDTGTELKTDGTPAAIQPEAPSLVSTLPNGDTVYRSDYGTLTFRADGTYTYTLNSGAFDADGNEVNRLAQGEVLTETFTVTVTDTFGKEVSTDITITIHGTNDKPRLELGDSTLHVTESGVGRHEDGTVVDGPDDDFVGASSKPGTAADEIDRYDGVSKDSDKAIGKDADHGAELVYGVEVGKAGSPEGVSFTTDGDDVSVRGQYGSLTIRADGTYSYTLDENSDFTADDGTPYGSLDHLNEGEVLTETFTIFVKDEHGAWASKEVTVTVTGTNDRPELTVTDEKAFYNDKDQLVDGGDGYLHAYGTASDESAVTRLEGRVQASDDDRENGAGKATTGDQNHGLEFSLQQDGYTEGRTSSSVWRDGSGHDLETGTVEVSQNGAGGYVATTEYGTLTLDQYGNYTYELHGENEDVTKLGKGESVTETFVVRVVDDRGAWSEKTITITIKGTDDKPVLSDDTESTLDVYEAGVWGSKPGATDPDKTFTGDNTLEATVTFEKQDAHDTHSLVIAGDVLPVKAPLAVTDGETSVAGATYTITDNGDGTYKVTATIPGVNNGNPIRLGTLTLEQNGTDGDLIYSFSPDQGKGGLDGLPQDMDLKIDIPLKVEDQNGNRSDGEHTATINIHGTNDRPTINFSQRAPEDVYADGVGREENGSTVRTPDKMELNPAENEGYTSTLVSGKLTASDVDADNDGFTFYVAGAQATGKSDIPLKCTANGDDTVTLTLDGVEVAKLVLDQTTGKYTLELLEGAKDALKSYGEDTEFSFKVTFKVKDEHGSSSTNKVEQTFTIHGTNDAPEITAVDKQDLAEDEASVTGLVTASDADKGHKLTYGLLSDSDFGRLNGDNPESVNMTTSLNNEFGTLTIDPDTGKYTFYLDPESEAVISLPEGEKKDLTFHVAVRDDKGAWSVEEITVTITGKDTATVFVGDAAVVSVVEAGIVPDKHPQSDNDFTGGVPSAHGKLEAKDYDTVDGRPNEVEFSINKAESGPEPELSDFGALDSEIQEAISQQFPGEDWSADADIQIMQGQYGTLYLNTATGQYFYQLDNSSDATNALKRGEIRYDDFSIHAQGTGTGDKQGADQPLKVAVKGSNDAPVLETVTLDEGQAGLDVSDDGFTVTGIVEDGSTRTVTGRIEATDVDSPDGSAADEGSVLKYLIKITGEDGVRYVGAQAGEYGYLKLNEKTGEYTFVFNNKAAQHLGEGDIGKASFTVVVLDEYNAISEEKDLTFTITGKDDAPVINNSSVSVTEDQTDPSKQETIEIFDPDTNDQRQFTSISSDKTNDSVNLTENGTWTIDGKYGILTVTRVDGELKYTYTLYPEEGHEASYKERQELNVGDSLTENFTVSGTSNGVPAQGTITVTITGENDAPTLKLEHDAGTETTGDGAIVVKDWEPVTGTADGHDVDNTWEKEAETPELRYSVSNSENPGSESGEGGEEQASSLQTIKGEFGYLTINSVTGEYTYVVDPFSDKYKELGSSEESGKETFTIWVKDPHGAFDRQDISFDVHWKGSEGSGGPIELASTTDVAVKEDGGDYDVTLPPSVDSGFKYLKDVTGEYVDVPADQIWLEDAGGNKSHVIQTDYGSLILEKNAEGQWGYRFVLNNSSEAVQELTEDDVIDLNLWVGTEEGNEVPINVTITGINDRPVIEAVTDLKVKDTGGVVPGKVETSDPDKVDVGSAEDGERNLIYKIEAEDDGFTLTKEGEEPTEKNFKLDLQGEPTEGYPRVYKVVDENNTTWGEFTLKEDGSYTFTPDADIADGLLEGEKAEFDLSITVDDGKGKDNSTASDTIHITIEGTNKEPVIEDEKLTLDVKEDTTVTSDEKQLQVTDDRGEGADNLSYSVAAGDVTGEGKPMAAGEYGTLFIDANGTYHYQLNNQLPAVQQLGEGASLTDTFTIFVKDKDGETVPTTVTVNIKGTNDDPVLSLSDPVLTIKEGTDGSVTGNALATDVDTGDTRTYSLKATGDGTVNEADGEYVYKTTYGTFYLDKTTGEYRFVLDNDAEAVKNLRPTDVVEDKVTVVVTDGYGGTSEKELTVHIKGDNTAPEVTDEESLELTVLEDVGENSGQIDATGWDSGPNDTGSDPLHYSVENAKPVTIDGKVWHKVEGEHGILYINPKTGDYRYELTEDMNYLADGESALDDFDITITDSTGLKTEETIKVTINGKNDAPSIVVSQPSGSQFGTVTITDVDTTDTHDVTFTGLYGSAEDATNGTALQVDLTKLENGKPLDVFNAAGEKIGELELTYTESSDGKNGGTLEYTFTPDKEYLNSLPVDQDKDINFSITVSDGHEGGTATQGGLHFTVTNENDAPVIMEATDPSAAGNNNSGKLKFSDADELDTQHSVTFTGLQDAGGNALAVESVEGLTEDKVVDVYKDGLQIGTLTLRYEDGELTYTLSTENFENNLPVGDSTIDFTITVSDKSGDTDTTDGNLQFTVTNDNDAPVIDEDLSQDPAAGNTGTLVFTDADVKDTHSVSFEGLSVDEDGTPLTVDLDSLPEEPITVYQDGQKVGELILTYSKGEDGTGTFTYAFDPDKNYLNSLPVGENKLDFGITVSDKNGREDTTGDLQFTVTNENDAPAITEEPSSGSNTGTLVFSDADVRDTHSVTFEGLYASESGKEGDSLKVDNVEGLTDGATTLDVYNESGQKIGTLKLAYTEGDGAGTEHTLTYTFTPDTEYSNSLDRDSSVSLDFDLKIHDDTEDSNTVKGSVTIESTNQAPVIGAPVDGGSNTGTVAITDSDPDDSLTVYIKDAEGTPVIIAAGEEPVTVDDVSYTYTDGTLRYEVLPERTDDLAPGKESTVEITVFVDDGHGKVEQTVSLPVTSTAPTEGGEGEGPTEGETVIVPDDGDQASLKAYGQRQRLAAEEAGLLTAAASFVAGITPEPADPETFLQESVPAAQDDIPEALMAEEIPLPQDETVLQEEMTDLPDADVPVSETPLADDLLAEPLLFAGLENADEMPEPVEMLRVETAEDMLPAEDTDPATAATPPAFSGEESGDGGLLLPEGVEGLFGTDGDDYLRGGEGSDAIFGGAGNDIIVYDQQDYLVSGGSGIDFMVSDDTGLTLDGLLSNTSSDKPLVSGIEVLLKGEDALSLTSIKDLADRYGITLGVNEAGEEILQLDDRWTKQDDGSYDFNGGAEADGGLTLETSLTPVETGDPASEAVQQQVFTLEHSNG